LRHPAGGRGGAPTPGPAQDPDEIPSGCVRSQGRIPAGECRFRARAPPVIPEDVRVHMPPETPLLDTVSSPADTRSLSIPQLRQLADELRAETIDAVSQTGGH